MAGQTLEIDVHPFGPDEETRNRLDFVTLRDGGVALYHADAVLSDDLEWLRQAGYAIFDFDGSKWRSREAFFSSFAAELHFPSYFGNNLDAFAECLSKDSRVPEQGLVVVIRGIDSTVANLGRAFVQGAIDLLSLASHEQLLCGRRLMFLLQSVNPRIEFRTIGARPVSWNSREFLYSSRGIQAMAPGDWEAGFYALNSALLFTHEVDSGFWREWELFRLPGGLFGFLAANLFLFIVVQVGFQSVVRGRPSRRVWGALLAAAGIIAPILHGAFLAAGAPQFRQAASMGLLGGWFITSIAQLVLLLMHRRDAG